MTCQYIEICIDDTVLIVYNCLQNKYDSRLLEIIPIYKNEIKNIDNKILKQIVGVYYDEIEHLLPKNN